MLIKHIRAHIFIYSSVLVHLIALAVFYTPTPDRDETMVKPVTDYGRQALLDKAKAEQALASDYVRRSYQARVDDMQDIKQLMAQVAVDENLDIDALVSEQISKNRTDSGQTYQQIYQTSLALKQDIDALVNGKAEQAQPSVDASQLPVDEMMQAVTNHHEQAKQALATFHQRYSKQRQGASVQLTNAKSGHGDGGQGTGDGGSDNNNDNKSSGNLLYQYTGGPAADTLPAQLSATPTFLVAGKAVGQDGRKADRLYLDTWYMLGPFDNPTAETQSHPPESHIDLDAVYPGKHDKLIRWQFYQTNRYPLVPQDGEGNATWYGYTEMYFDQPTTLWVALGCDDNCKLWLDQRLVWTSGTQHKPWFSRGGYAKFYHEVANWGLIERYQRIEFKQGRNKLLFRLDNGYADVFFSMVLMGES